MVNSKVKISTIIESQLPSFVREDYPLVAEFLKQYYISLESKSLPLDIIENLNHYVKLDELTNLTETTELTSIFDFPDDVLNVTSTEGFPDSYGLILIDNEIITYQSKTDTTFEGCIRGFSGVTGYGNFGTTNELIFEQSSIDSHAEGSLATNLSVLFLKEFFIKLKTQIAPGFEQRELYSNLNDNIFFKQVKDFYSTKGTDESFKILFKALYGDVVEVIKPRDFLISPSDAQYNIVKNIIVEPIDGDPLQLVNRTLYQDSIYNIPAAKGVVSKVEKIRRNNKFYYRLSLDYGYNRDIEFFGTLYGEFSSHPKTKIISSVLSTSIPVSIDVDSTVGFPNEGELIVNLDNGTQLTINYKSKTLTQFLECSGIDQNLNEGQEIFLNAFAYGYDNDENIVKIKINSIIFDINITDNTFLLEENDSAKIKTLGKDNLKYIANNWIFNYPITYDIKTIQLLSATDKTLKYKISLYDDHIFKINDFAELIASNNIVKNIKIERFENKNNFIVITDRILGESDLVIDNSLVYKLKRKINKFNVLNKPDLSVYNTDIQNVYIENDDYFYVTSSSFPSYTTPLVINDKIIYFSGTFNGQNLNIGKHNFYTGDFVYYNYDRTEDLKTTTLTYLNKLEVNNLGIKEGYYYVYRVDNTTIRLARSKDDISQGRFLSFSASVKNNSLQLASLANKTIQPQKLIKKIPFNSNLNYINDDNYYETKPGKTGIFINGVELLNYKSRDNVFYGKINSVDVIKPGNDYDVINPPILTISDSVGYGASAYCSVSGSLERFDIVDPGFDYLNPPQIIIEGGNGSGAEAKASLVLFTHESPFNPKNNVNYSTNTIGFSTFHKFKNYEKVLYDPNGNTAISGITTNSIYYVSVQDALNIKLHNTFEDCIVGINTVLLTYSTNTKGVHKFIAVDKKRKIQSIKVTNPGKGYENKKTIVSNDAVNVQENSIKLPNHNYKSGEIIVYTCEGTPITGLTTETSYYVTCIDDDKIKLSELSLTTQKDINYKTKTYIDFQDRGNGKHIFNYPKISVKLISNIGISTIQNESFEAKVIPIFRGQISSVFVENNGNNYGAEDIINYEKQPNFNLNTGSGAVIKPVISNGKIVDVLIINSGNNYNSQPTLKIYGNGSGAVLTPIISDGRLTSVVIISEGFGYENKNTSIEIISSGNNGKFKANIEKWNINLVEKYFKDYDITTDDGFIDTENTLDKTLQYTHAYAPRKLRQITFSTKVRDGEITYVPDLYVDTLGNEKSNDAHSPIIGWAYDGNPIYGPYGYSNNDGGRIKALKSGYQLIEKQNRPNKILYPLGFFVEDYEYQNIGDLDEHNGRFCVTPEYPTGVYAYFCTINSNYIESRPSQFAGNIKPVFPYVIGNHFKSHIIDFNFDKTINQDTINLNKTNWLRNTTQYNILSDKTRYDYIPSIKNINDNLSVIKYCSPGSIDFINIFSPGKNYKVDDKILFDNKNDNNDAKARVSYIEGKDVVNVSVSSTSLNNVQFIKNDDETYIGFSTVSHNLLSGDLVTFNSKYEVNKLTTIKIGDHQLNLSVGINSTQKTGIVTYFYVLGALDYPKIKEDDIYVIQNEEIKILNIDKLNSRIRVLRNCNGTVGINSYAPGTNLTQKIKPIITNIGLSSSYNLSLNKKFYFDPKESVGLGTTSGIGINTTLYFSNPGAGIASITIPTKTIYLPNHNLKTGDKLIYSSNGGTQLSVSSNGSTSTLLTENGILYAIKVNDNLIGITTNKIGIGSFGNYSEIVSNNSNILYFTGVGIGNTHSFTTVYDNTLIGSIDRHVVNVSTAETHGLSLLDEINLECISNLVESYDVKYNYKNKRVLLNSKDFISLDVNIINNTIKIANHRFTNGQKIIHNSALPCGGLVDDSIYYISVVDKDTFKLCSSYYNSIKENPEEVNISSASYGTISLINPQIFSTKNNKIIFNLSDSSLSYYPNSGISSYSAFDFKIYSDQNQKNEYYISTSTSSTFDVVKFGRIGIDTDAKIIVNVNEHTPKVLYYKLVPIGISTQNNVINDYENIINNNSIHIVDSIYSGKYNVVSVSSTSFAYNISRYPENGSYNSSTSSVKYYTNSITANGGIKDIELLNKGKNYKKLPGISSIISDDGYGAILTVESNNIGNFKKLKIYDIGTDYSNDYSIRPLVKLPDLLKVDVLSSIDNILVKSNGYYYLTAPDLILIDNYTNRVIDDILLDYKLASSTVNILKNTNSIHNIVPRIVPTNNSNGIKISNLSFNNSTKEVSITLGSVFSDIEDFPFEIGDKFMIEGVGITSTGTGYNSKDYNYSFFTVTDIIPNIGFFGGIIKYKLSNYLNDGEIPGTYDPSISYGFVIPEKYMPIFEVNIRKNELIKGESIKSKNYSGVVEGWDKNNGILKVSSISDIKINDVVTGQISGVSVLIKDVISFNSSYNINSYSIVENGWNLNTGFLNDHLQRVHDNDYYQYFSYSVKSHIDYTRWNGIVNTLNHSVGFKKFSDLTIESPIDSANTFDSKGIFVGVTTSQNDGQFGGIADISEFIDVNCISDFDLGKEKLIGNYSNGITFLSKTLQDYIESTGNRVLMIDDISSLFNNNPRPTPYSIIDSFDIFSSKYKKYILLIQDQNNTELKQIMIVSLLHDGQYGYLNQYARVENDKDLGYFDFNVTDITGNLLFYPVKFKNNNYYVNFLSFNFDSNSVGVASTSLGNIVSMQTHYNTLNQGETNGIKIAGISSSYRANKLHVEISSVDNNYLQFNELTILHDGQNISILNYGDLNTNNLQGIVGTGIGTFNAYYSGSNINVELVPAAGLTTSYNSKVFNVSIGNTTFTGIGTYNFDTGYICSNYSLIPASSGITTIASYSTDLYSGGYFLVSIENTTDKTYQVSEIMVLNDQSDIYITEYGTIFSNQYIGKVKANISGSLAYLYFESLVDKNIQIRVFQTTLGLFNNINSSELDLYRSNIKSNFSSYFGTENDIIKSFDLKYKGRDIFKREFNTSDINLSKNTIRIPENFFVTGEEIIYQNTYGNPIGIATTVISGVSTSILPSSVYVIKLNELDIQVAASATDALSYNPKPLILYNLPQDSRHQFIAKKQNEKCLITIDNNIQKPIVSTASTTHLTQNVTVLNSILKFNDTKKFSDGDTIKINDEIMRINAINFGGIGHVLVERKYLGTKLSAHNANDIVTKIYGDYNIQDNIINFNSYPYGLFPTSSLLNPPDQRDYSGISSSSSFSGRVFIRSGVTDTQIEPYTYNYIFDDFSDKFNGITTQFTLKTNGKNITGISTSNSIFLIDNIFQQPSDQYHSGYYSLKENLGITSIVFNQSSTSIKYDPNISNIPTGGTILSVASSSGYGYQPLVCAGGTALISIAGTIKSISIGNSGSGYRSGIQTTVNVGVITSHIDSTLINIGYATINNGNVVSVAITNPGTGYTYTNPPIVIFDEPLSYSDLKLKYLYPNSGVGTEATININVGQGSSVINFELKYLGYGYANGDVLTVDYGGSTGIPTDITKSFAPFTITVESTYSKLSAGWTIGDIQIVDSIEHLFDSSRKLFPIIINGNQTTIRAKKGSNIDVEATLIIIVNDVIQVPGKSYNFKGGSIIEFTEAPKENDTCKIFFYKGTGDVDVKAVDILETVKVGDSVALNSDNIIFNESERIVTQINSTDDIDTTLYTKSGISNDANLIRPIKWCKQTEDLIINGIKIPKNRSIYEASIYPTTNIIQNVGTSSTIIYVENVRTFFDNISEYDTNDKAPRTITLISQDEYGIPENPAVIENIVNVQYSGDFGIISGISTAVIGIASTALKFDFYIPMDSFLRDTSIVGTSVTISNIKSGDYFVLSNSNVGSGIISLKNDNSIIGIGSTFIDNIYQVYSVSIAKTDVLSIGSTYVAQVVVKASSWPSGIGYSGYYGNFSWGKITNLSRKNPKSFNSYTNGISGIKTSAIVRRSIPLKYQNYS